MSTVSISQLFLEYAHGYPPVPGCTLTVSQNGMQIGVGISDAVTGDAVVSGVTPGLAATCVITVPAGCTFQLDKSTARTYVITPQYNYTLTRMNVVGTPIAPPVPPVPPPSPAYGPPGLGLTEADIMFQELF